MSEPEPDEVSQITKDRARQMLDELDIDENIGYDYGSVDTLVTNLVWKIEQLEDELKRERER